MQERGHLISIFVDNLHEEVNIRIGKLYIRYYLLCYFVNMFKYKYIIFRVSIKTITVSKLYHCCFLQNYLFILGDWIYFSERLPNDTLRTINLKYLLFNEIVTFAHLRFLSLALLML